MADLTELTMHVSHASYYAATTRVPHLALAVVLVLLLASMCSHLKLHSISTILEAVDVLLQQSKTATSVCQEPSNHGHSAQL